MYGTEVYSDVDYLDDTDLIQTLEDVYSETEKQFVVVIDEWDVVFRERKEDREGQTEYLDFLRDWLKDQEYIALAYMTGILPIKNYWNKTETYEALADYIKMNQDGLKDAVALMMDGGRVKADISTYQNDMTTFHNRDDVLALLIHLGYLGYDDETQEVFIPNQEILNEFKISTKSDEWIDALREL